MPAISAALVLVCIGGGTAIKPDSATVSGTTSGTYDYGRGQYSGTVDGTVSGTRAQEYSEQVDVEISGDEGRIRLPRVTLPLIRGGDDGWFELKKLRITAATIEGSAGVNILNRPKVHIDRRTGTISITGMNGTYVGRCEKVDPEAEQQF